MDGAERLLASVVIPTHDRAPSLLRALDRLAHQTLPAEAVEVVVVADGCTDATAELARALATPYRLMVLEQAATGPAAARNAGAAMARAPLLVFMDDDIAPDPGFLAAHVAAHGDGGDGVVIGDLPPVLYGQRGLFREVLAGWWERMFAVMAEPDHVFRYTDLLTGNVSLPAALFHRVGGFDPALRCHEDYEFGLRLLAAGASFRFDRHAWGHHHEHTDLARALRRKFDEGRADVMIGRQHPDVIPQLPLARYDGRDHRVLRRLAFLSPTLGDGLGRFGLLLMDTAERRDRRQDWQRLCDLLLGYWYWRGVAGELGGLDLLRRFLRMEQV